MRSNQVGNEIKNKTPPDSAKYITHDLLHSSHQANTMVDLGKELEQEHQQKYCHHQLYLLLFD